MHNTRKCTIGNIIIGGGLLPPIQSMLNAHSDDVSANVQQAISLEDAGCDILRVAIPNMESVRLINAIKSAIKIPLVADIHFDYKLALESVAAGVDKIRLNPGNIGPEDRIKAVVKACAAKNIPIRIGVNGGSLEKHILEKYQKPTPEALVESAMYHAQLLEKFDFNDIVISLKASSVSLTVKAYREMAKISDYPLHLGITEAGTSRMGIVKSSIGIGSLLLDGIGDTLRVSLTASPVEEISAAKDILNALDIGNTGVKIVSCPTCGRTKIDLIKLANQVEDALKDCKLNITVAVMGCAVNGPGEAKQADLGIAGGDNCGIIFAKGEIIGKYPQEDLLKALLAEVEKLNNL